MTWAIKLFIVFVIIVSLTTLIKVDNPYIESQENYPRISLFESITTVNLEGVPNPSMLVIVLGVIFLLLEKGLSQSGHSVDNKGGN